MTPHIRLGLVIAVALALTPPARAARNSSPAQVAMIANMPATFSLQAGQATMSGAAGSVQAQTAGSGRLIIRGQVRGRGGRVVVRIPLFLAANTRNFVVQALADADVAQASVYLAAPGMMARRTPLRGRLSLAMASARDQGHQFFALNRPLPSSLEIVFEDVPPQQARNFSLLLYLRDLGY